MIEQLMLSFVVCVAIKFFRYLTRTTTTIISRCIKKYFSIKSIELVGNKTAGWHGGDIFIKWWNNFQFRTCTRKFSLPPRDFCFCIFNLYWNASDSFCNVNQRFVNWFSKIIKSDRFEILMSFVMAPLISSTKNQTKDLNNRKEKWSDCLNKRALDLS